MRDAVPSTRTEQTVRTDLPYCQTEPLYSTDQYRQGGVALISQGYEQCSSIRGYIKAVAGWTDRAGATGAEPVGKAPTVARRRARMPPGAPVPASVRAAPRGPRCRRSAGLRIADGGRFSVSGVTRPPRVDLYKVVTTAADGPPRTLACGRIQQAIGSRIRQPWDSECRPAGGSAGEPERPRGRPCWGPWPAGRRPRSAAAPPRGETFA